MTVVCLERCARLRDRQGHGTPTDHGPIAADDHAGGLVNLRYAVPSPDDIRDLDDGYYAAPVLFDDHEWVSFTPCHLRPVTRAITDFAGSGEQTVRCRFPRCGQLWNVVWDPSDAAGRR